MLGTSTQNSTIYSGITDTSITVNGLFLPNYYMKYEWSSTGKKCSSLVEPHHSNNMSIHSNDSINYYYTEQEAWEAFNKKLNEHVNFLIDQAIWISDNSALEKRLIKYKNDKALKALQTFQNIVKSIPKIP